MAGATAMLAGVAGAGGPICGEPMIAGAFSNRSGGSWSNAGDAG